MDNNALLIQLLLEREQVIASLRAEVAVLRQSTEVRSTAGTLADPDPAQFGEARIAHV